MTAQARATANGNRKGGWYTGIPGASDRGQRYQVLYRDGKGTRRPYGYTDSEAEARAFASQCRCRGWRGVKIVDRQGRAK